MEWKKTLALLGMVLAFTLYACDNAKSPSSPDVPNLPETPTANTPSTPSTPATPTTPTTPTNPNTSRGDYLGAKDGKVGAILENLTDEEMLMGFACYIGPQHDPGQQYLPDPEEDYFIEVKVKGGDDKEVWIKEPCGPYQCDAYEGKTLKKAPWYGTRLVFGRLGKGEVNCGSDEPKCPRDAFATIDASIPASLSTGGCPESVPVTWNVSTNLHHTSESFPPELVKTSPNTGTLPVKDQPASYNFYTTGFMADGTKCADGMDTVTVRGCQCEPCVDSHLNHEIIYGEASCDGQDVTVKVSSSHPGTANIGNSTENFAAGNHQWTYHLDCGQAIKVLITNKDDKCGEPLVCNTIEDTIEVECPRCCDEDLKVSVDEKEAPEGFFKLEWTIVATSPGQITIDGKQESFPAGTSYITKKFPCGEDGSYWVGWDAYLDNECDKDGGGFEIPECENGCEVPDESCKWQIGQRRCSDYGLVTIHKNDSGGRTSCTIAEMDAAGVIVKGGLWYHFIPNVKQGDEICTCDFTSGTAEVGTPQCKDWSHVEYCACPPN